MNRWAQSIKEKRILRVNLKKQGRAVEVIQRALKWKTWTKNFRSMCEFKRVLRKHMWYMMLQWRIANKSRAVTKIIVGVRQMASTLEVVAAFGRYKYKIRLMQRRARQVLAAKHCQLAASKAQYHKVRRHQQSVQLAGDGTEAKKKLKKKASKKTSAHDPKDKIREINFLLLPDANNAVVAEELHILTQSRRQRFAQHIQMWRKAYRQWERNSSYLIAEGETDKMMGKIDDFSSEPMSNEYPFLLELPTQKFSWARFLALEETKREFDNRYRLGGPPRPMFKVALDETLELFPLFHRVRNKMQ